MIKQSNKKKEILGFFYGITIFIVITSVYEGSRWYLKSNNVYLDQIQIELNEKIIDKTRINNTCFLFETDKSNAFMLDQGTQNWLYRDIYKSQLFVILGVGDSISKKANNDTMYVYQGDKKYLFVTGKVINRPNPDHRE